MITAFLDSAEPTELTRVMTYEALLRKPPIRGLFAWLGLELGAADLSRLRAVRAARVGSSFSDVGREVDAATVKAVMAPFDEEMASTLRTLDSGVKEPLLRWYPDLARLRVRRGRR